MISTQAQDAILILQSRAVNASDSYTLERIDRALDEIVRNPSKTDPPEHQVRSALANAAKIIDGRRKLAPEISDDDLMMNLSVDEDGYDLIDLRHWLETAQISVSHRSLLLALVEGAEVRELACQAGVPVERMRERISRARKNARLKYATSTATL